MTASTPQAKVEKLFSLKMHDPITLRKENPSQDLSKCGASVGLNFRFNQRNSIWPANCFDS